jgi:23S rRNA pseudouridine1911/1915/1917 synthase
MSAIRERLQVEAEAAGQRLDRWLTDALLELDYAVSRSQVRRWIDEGHVEGPKARIKPSDPVEPGEWYAVSVPAPEPVALAAEPIPIDVVFEDDDVIVVNKPRGMVVHPAAGHASGTLVNALLGRGTPLSQLGGQWRPGVVHRIDKDTSGLIMFAKTDLAYHSLAEQLHAHSVERMYLAIAHGVVAHDVGTIDAPIGRDPRNRQRMAVTPTGKHAVTHFRVLERFADYTYLKLQLETGRTHQIRVHMAYIGHPLAGDPLYGRRHTLPVDGQALHAAVLGFTHPATGERLHFEAPPPNDMQFLLEGLRSGIIG